MSILRGLEPHPGRVTSAAVLLGLLVGCGHTEPSSPPAGTQEVATDVPSGGESVAPVDSPAAPAPRLAPLPPELRDAARLNRQGRFEAARSLTKRYAARNPDDGRAEFILGLTYHQAGNHGPATPHFERALALAPDYYLTHLYFGDSLFLVGDMAGARREYEAYGAAQPSEPLAHYSVGLVDLEEADLDDAEARFREAIALFDRMRGDNPRLYAARSGARARCHARLADVHFARDEYDAARDELIASTTIAPGNISAFHALSLVYRRLGENDLADQALDRYKSDRQAIIDRRRRSGG